MPWPLTSSSAKPSHGPIRRRAFTRPSGPVYIPVSHDPPLSVRSPQPRVRLLASLPRDPCVVAGRSPHDNPRPDSGPVARATSGPMNATPTGARRPAQIPGEILFNGDPGITIRRCGRKGQFRSPQDRTRRRDHRYRCTERTRGNRPPAAGPARLHVPRGVRPSGTVIAGGATLARKGAGSRAAAQPRVLRRGPGRGPQPAAPGARGGVRPRGGARPGPALTSSGSWPRRGRAACRRGRRHGSGPGGRAQQADLAEHLAGGHRAQTAGRCVSAGSPSLPHHLGVPVSMTVRRAVGGIALPDDDPSPAYRSPGPGVSPTAPPGSGPARLRQRASATPEAREAGGGDALRRAACRRCRRAAPISPATATPAPGPREDRADPGTASARTGSPNDPAANAGVDLRSPGCPTSDRGSRRG